MKSQKILELKNFSVFQIGTQYSRRENQWAIFIQMKVLNVTMFPPIPSLIKSICMFHSSINLGQK